MNNFRYIESTIEFILELHCSTHTKRYEVRIWREEPKLENRYSNSPLYADIIDFANVNKEYLSPGQLAEWIASYYPGKGLANYFPEASTGKITAVQVKDLNSPCYTDGVMIYTVPF